MGGPGRQQTFQLTEGRAGTARHRLASAISIAATDTIRLPPQRSGLTGRRRADVAFDQDGADRTTARAGQVLQNL